MENPLEPVSFPKVMFTDGKQTGCLKSLKKTNLSFCDEAASFLQSGFWGSFKAGFGWEALAFSVEWECGTENTSKTALETKPLLVLCRKVAFGLSLAYIPWGPELPEEIPRFKAMNELAVSLKVLLPKGTVLIRFDPPWFVEGLQPSTLPKPFIDSLVDIQAPDTVIIDLSQSIESIIGNMKAKWRYNARLAQKKGVRVFQADEEKLGVFYDLLVETAKRDIISIHSFDYYKTLFETSNIKGDKPELRLYLAEHEEEVIAGIVTIFRGKQAVYLYGASSDKKRNLMAPYTLQLKAIEDAKSFGCENYDLYGISPSDDPSHPMAGLYRFKTGFGGMIKHHLGCWDYPCNQIVYYLFRLAEYLRKMIMLFKKNYLRSSSKRK